MIDMLRYDVLLLSTHSLSSLTTYFRARFFFFFILSFICSDAPEKRNSFWFSLRYFFLLHERGQILLVNVSKMKRTETRRQNAHLTSIHYRFFFSITTNVVGTSILMLNVASNHHIFKVGVRKNESKRKRQTRFKLTLLE